MTNQIIDSFYCCYQVSLSETKKQIDAEVTSFIRVLENF